MRETLVLPRYSDLFGCEPSPDDLLQIVRAYPRQEWLSYLSRIQNLLGAERVGNQEQMRAVFQGVLSKDVQDRLAAYGNRMAQRAQLGLFYERQISTLQQLALLHAPIEGATTFDTETGRHDLGCTLLMTANVMDEGRPQQGDRQGALACLIQHQLRMSVIPAEQHAARAYQFYELANENPPDVVREYLGLFEVATGVSARDSILGGLCEIIREETLELAQIAHGWHAVAAPERCENPLEAEVLRASARVRWRTPDALRGLITGMEGSRPIGDWNLIALSKAPIVDLDETGAFVLNHTALGRSLFDGVRHAVLTAAHERRLPDPYRNAKSVGGLYGRVLQRYVTKLLRLAFPDRVIEIPEGTDRRCDLLIWFPDKVVLVEIKGEHYAAVDHASYLTLEKRHEELCRIGIPKAVKQVSTTMQALRNGTLPIAGLPAYDWTTTPIVPLVVTEERTPQVPMVWEQLYGPFDRPLETDRAAGPVGKLRLLSVDEVETLPDITGAEGFASLLYRWGSTPDYYDMPWLAFLDTRGIRWTGQYVQSQFLETMRFLAGRLGLNRNAITD